MSSKKRKESDQKNRVLINHFKDSVKRIAINNGIGNTVEFNELKEKDETVVSAFLIMENYKAVLEYTIAEDVYSYIDNGIVYPEKGDSQFNIVDIFTLFDIEDFDSYFYSDVTNKTKIDESVDVLIEMFLKYDYEIKKANESNNYKRLKKVSQDREKAENHEEVSIRDKIKLSNTFDKYRRNPSEKTRQKLIAELEKAERKGYLAPENKRDLKKLKAGEDVKYKIEQRDIDYEFSKQWRTLVCIVNLIIFALCFCVIFITFVIRSKNGFTIFNKDYLFAGFISGLSLSIGFDFGFSHKIIRKRFEKQGKKASEDTSDFEYKGKIDKLKSKIIIPILFPIVGMFILIFGMSVTVLTDNGLTEYNVFSTTEYSFSQLDTYKILGTENKNGSYSEYKYPYYYFVDSDGIVYSIGPVAQDGDNEKIEEIFSKNNIVPTVLRSDNILFETKK